MEYNFDMASTDVGDSTSFSSLRNGTIAVCFTVAASCLCLLLPKIIASLRPIFTDAFKHINSANPLPPEVKKLEQHMLELRPDKEFRARPTRGRS